MKQAIASSELKSSDSFFLKIYLKRKGYEVKRQYAQIYFTFMLCLLAELTCIWSIYKSMSITCTFAV